jgi:hypothetical protein
MSKNREQEGRAVALQRFLEEQLPAYATWRQRRHEQFHAIENLADICYPLIDTAPLMNDWIARNQAVRANDDTVRRKKDFIRRHQRNWENKSKPTDLGEAPGARSGVFKNLNMFLELGEEFVPRRKRWSTSDT